MKATKENKIAIVIAVQDEDVLVSVAAVVCRNIPIGDLKVLYKNDLYL